MSELPKGWVETTLEEVAEFKNGYAFKSNWFQDEGIPVIRIGDIYNGKVLVTASTKHIPSKFESDYSRFLICCGDFLIALSGATTGKGGFYRSNDLAFLNQRVLAIRSSLGSAQSQRYLGLFASKASEIILKQAKGGAQPNISPNTIKAFQINLPPANEQKRIVDKLEKCEARIDAAKAALDDVPQLLEHYRQSVLAAAFRGDLTRDWRTAHPDAEPAEQLLERLRDERRQRWEQAELEKYEAKGKAPPKNWKQKYKAPQPLTEAQLNELPELPEGWCWCSLRELATHKSGIAYKSKEFTKEGIQVVKLGNLYKGQFDLSRDPSFIPEDHNDVEAGLIPPTALLVSQTGTRRKRDYGHFVLANSNEPMVLNQRVLAVIPDTDWLRSWIHLTTKLSLYRDFFFSHETGGVNQGNVGIEGVMGGMIPVAPEAEAVGVLSAITSYYSIVSTLENAQTKTETDLEYLTQSLLAKAFRGELVSQDPNDEPASKLLERIAEARKQAKPTPRKRARKQAQVI